MPNCESARRDSACPRLTEGSVLVPRTQEDLPTRVMVVVRQVPRCVVELVFELISEIYSLKGNPEVRSHDVLRRRVEIEGRIEAVGVGARLLPRDLGEITAAVRTGHADAPLRILVVQREAGRILRQPEQLVGDERTRTGRVFDLRLNVRVIQEHTEVA